AALVPVIAYQMIEGVHLIPDVCVGARERVRSVCLVTKGEDLSDVRSVSLDVSSKTSVALTKIIFREFLGFEPKWKDAEPDLNKMLADSDCALLIGDPALGLSPESGVQSPKSPTANGGLRIANHQLPTTNYRKFDLLELWRKYTGFGFVFAMWMTHDKNCGIDFAAARDEGLGHLEEIAANYKDEISLSGDDFKTYLTENISFSIDDSMRHGLELYFKLASSHDLIPKLKPLSFA
ncbi:MAG: hypothetical protein HKN25_18545, partial [Pyrinomonadaceae bacterium]|nr:hypothetical protein [Pyrinomonadaceae bacterium]